MIDAGISPSIAEATIEQLREALTDVINHWILSDAPEPAVIDRAITLLDSMEDRA